MSAFTEPLAQLDELLAELSANQNDDSDYVYADRRTVAKAQDALDRVERLATDMETALAEAIQVIEWCGLNDKTPTYNYNEARSDGTKPTVGQAFNTPREFARYWPDNLRAVLSAREKGTA